MELPDGRMSQDNVSSLDEGGDPAVVVYLHVAKHVFRAIGVPNRSRQSRISQVKYNFSF